MFEYSSQPEALLRNRAVDLLLIIATPPRPGCTTCTNGTPQCSGSTACTQCARHPVHDPFHDQRAASGPHITLGDGVKVTLSERRTVTHARARTRRPGRQATIQNALLRLVRYSLPGQRTGLLGGTEPAGLRGGEGRWGRPPPPPRVRIGRSPFP